MENPVRIARRYEINHVRLIITIPTYLLTIAFYLGFIIYWVSHSTVRCRCEAAFVELAPFEVGREPQDT